MHFRDLYRIRIKFSYQSRALEDKWECVFQFGVGLIFSEYVLFLGELGV
jgi:hypothetical protein